MTGATGISPSLAASSLRNSVDYFLCFHVVCFDAVKVVISVQYSFRVNFLSLLSNEIRLETESLGELGRMQL